MVNESTGDDQITAEQMAWEISEAHRLDPNHRAVTTTFDGWNVMVDWLQTNLVPVLDGSAGYPSGHPAADAASRRRAWSGHLRRRPFDAVQVRDRGAAHVMEGGGDQLLVGTGEGAGQRGLADRDAGAALGYRPGRLHDPAICSSAPRSTGNAPLQVVLLWGVETWLADPAWMDAATQAMGILRTPSAVPAPSRLVELSHSSRRGRRPALGQPVAHDVERGRSR